jgi:LuxR family maltose regulon positive regulatory protein
MLQAAERAGKASPDLPAAHLSELRGMIAAVRAYVAFFQGDVSRVIAWAEEALACLPREKSMLRAAAASAMADTYSMSGDLDRASKAYAGAIELAKAADNAYLLLLTSLKLATNLAYRGEIAQAIEMCEEQLQYARESGFAATPRAGGIQAVWASLLRERGDLDRALELSRQSLELCERGSNIVVIGLALLALAETSFSRGDLAGMEQSLRRLEAHGQASDLPTWIAGPLTAWKARLSIARGRFDDAEKLLRERGVNAQGPLALVRMDEYLALARLSIARAAPVSDLPDALHLLGRLRAVAEGADIVGKRIEVAALEALACQKRGDRERALSSLENALSMASKRGYVRVFVDEGRPMAELLYQAVRHDLSPRYASHLLAAFDGLDVEPASPRPGEPSLPEGIEPLSERETEVLELIAQGLTNREVARALFVSIGTVKVHTHNIYGKLDVHSRTQAVAKARALGVLPSSQ